MMFSLSVQALSGHVYTVPVSSSTTVRDVKQKIRSIDQDWQGTGVTTPTVTPPTRRVSQSTIPEFHAADEPSRITPPEKETTLEPMEVIQEEDPYSEMDTLLTPDGQPLIDSDPIEKYLPSEGIRQRNPSIISKDDPTSPKVLYRLKSYPSYGDYIQVQMRRWQMDKGWKGIAINFTLITLAAFFLAAMAQASFNLPKSWSDYLELTYIVAVTFQTFAVLLSASLLGAYRSTLSVIMYLLMICAGAPFGALQRGGYKVLYGGTAGYLYGYIFASMLVGYLASRGWDRRYRTIILSMFLGNVVIYVCGLLYMPFGRSVQSNPHKTPTELYCGKPHGCVGQVFYDGLIPFIPGDLIKIGIASAILPLGWKILGWRASQKRIIQEKEAVEMA